MPYYYGSAYPYGYGPYYGYGPSFGLYFGGRRHGHFRRHW
jgi:hypothetical protein